MRHRHLDLEPDTPVEEWPAAAIADVLDRGDLDDWRPILRGIAADPHGPLARRVASLVDAFPMYGTSALWRGWLDRCRVRGAPGPETAVSEGVAPSSLADLRRASGRTQAEVADLLGISQSDVSKLERRPDVRVSTLRGYLSAVGARLRLVAVNRDGEREIAAPPPPQRRRR